MNRINAIVLAIAGACLSSQGLLANAGTPPGKTHGDVGKVKDLVVDLVGSRVRYVVVDFYRAWTPNDKLVALPPTAFADGASTSAWQPPAAEGAGAPRNAPPALALVNPGEPTKGTASAVNPEESLATRPLPVDPNGRATIQALPHEPLPSTTSYVSTSVEI